MTLTAHEGELLKQIKQIYGQWDPQWDRLMPVDELASRLPAFEPQFLLDTLAKAASDQLVELDRGQEQSRFRPLRN